MSNVGDDDEAYLIVVKDEDEALIVDLEQNALNELVTGVLQIKTEEEDEQFDDDDKHYDVTVKDEVESESEVNLQELLVKSEPEDKCEMRLVTVRRASKKGRFGYTKDESFVDFIDELTSKDSEINEDGIVSELIKKMSMEVPPEVDTEKIMYEKRDGKTALLCCKVCDYTNTKIAKMIRHYNNRHGEKFIKCYACGFPFRYPTALYKHERKSCKGRRVDLILRARTILFGKEARGHWSHVRNKQRHLVKSEFPPPKPPGRATQRCECNECGSTFSSKEMLISHLNGHAGIRPYRCKLCDNAYTTLTTLKRHLVIHDPPKYCCEDCGRSFHRRDAYKVHAARHNGIRGALFMCDECERTFTKKEDFINHKRKHMGLPKPYKCTECDKRFIRPSMLKNHISKDHNATLLTKQLFYKRRAKMSNEEIKQNLHIMNLPAPRSIEDTLSIWDESFPIVVQK